MSQQKAKRCFSVLLLHQSTVRWWCPQDLHLDLFLIMEVTLSGHLRQLVGEGGFEPPTGHYSLLVYSQVVSTIHTTLPKLASQQGIEPCPYGFGDRLATMASDSLKLQQ